MRQAELTLAGQASSVPAARHFVERLLASWGVDDLAWNAALAVTELAANCALHARTDFTVRVLQEAAGAVRIEVSDHSPRVPVQRSYGNESTTGRGLWMLAHLVQEWGVTASRNGKTVWLRLEVSGPASRAPGEDSADEDEVTALLAAFDDGEPHPGSAPSMRLPRVA